MSTVLISEAFSTFVVGTILLSATKQVLNTYWCSWTKIWTKTYCRDHREDLTSWGICRAVCRACLGRNRGQTRCRDTVFCRNCGTGYCGNRRTSTVGFFIFILSQSESQLTIPTVEPKIPRVEETKSESKITTAIAPFLIMMFDHWKSALDWGRVKGNVVPFEIS